MSDTAHAWSGRVGDGWHVIVRATVCKVLGHDLARRKRFDAVCTRCSVSERLW